MTTTTQERLESSAHLILEVAKAASSLELTEVLEALIVALKPIISFDAIAVFVIEGEYARLHSLHVERVGRRPGESVESVIARTDDILQIAAETVDQATAQGASRQRSRIVAPALRVHRSRVQAAISRG